MSETADSPYPDAVAPPDNLPVSGLLDSDPNSTGPGAEWSRKNEQAWSDRIVLGSARRRSGAPRRRY